jgi:hypothetical protein
MGGNIFKNTSPIRLGDVSDLVNQLTTTFDIKDIKWALAGSAAVDVSFTNHIVNDIDIAIDTTSLYLNFLQTEFSGQNKDSFELLNDLFLNFERRTNKGSSLVSISYPFRGKNYQIDFILTDNLDFITNLYFTSDNTSYKSGHRNVLFQAIMDFNSTRFIKNGVWVRDILTVADGLQTVIQTNLSEKVCNRVLKSSRVIYTEFITKDWTKIETKFSVASCMFSFESLWNHVQGFYDTNQKIQIVDKALSIFTTKSTHLEIPIELCEFILTRG